MNWEIADDEDRPAHFPVYYQQDRIGPFKLLSKMEAWECQAFFNRGYQTGYDPRFVRVGEEFLRLPIYEGEFGTAPVCERCPLQFSCLAGNVGRLTSNKLPKTPSTPTDGVVDS